MRIGFNNLFGQSASYEEKIYDECHKRLYFTALRILNDSFDAEEVMHDTLLKYFSTEVKFSNNKERDRWLTRVCVNSSIDRLRKRGSVELVSLEKDFKSEDQSYSESEEYSYKGITVKMVKEALEKLADGYRVILSLNLFEGYDYEEIAQITQLKEVTVRTQFIRGKARLVEELESLKHNINKH
ncbi:sigma-70 family RNA polymerase sigma factor [Bacteroidota bacterium]